MLPRDDHQPSLLSSIIGANFVGITFRLRCANLASTNPLSPIAILGVGPYLNFIQHLLLWKYRLKMRTFVELERIIWRTSKVFVFGNPYNTVIAMKPEPSLMAMDGAVFAGRRLRMPDGGFT